ncbi:UNVERIFIED_CONTAM: SH3 domain-containing protein 1 [Sesamum indicum]
MEAIKKQASKLREQVARQQQAILRQLGQLGHGGVMIDEADVQLHQQLQNLYKSTRAAKHFQRDIVRGLDGFVSASKKQMEIARKLAEDCCKYGIENQDSDSPLARIAQGFGTSHASMEDHRETMLGILSYQISEPLRALINGAPLEDARHLTHQYDRMRQEFEIQVDAERSYHRNVVAILEKLHSEVIHPFDAQADGELSLEVDNYVVVRQVTSNGWSEGECEGKAGWFPSAYVEKIDRIPTSKLAGDDSSP